MQANIEYRLFAQGVILKTFPLVRSTTSLSLGDIDIIVALSWEEKKSSSFADAYNAAQKYIQTHLAPSLNAAQKEEAELFLRTLLIALAPAGTDEFIPQYLQSSGLTYGQFEQYYTTYLYRYIYRLLMQATFLWYGNIFRRQLAAVSNGYLTNVFYPSTFYVPTAPARYELIQNFIIQQKNRGVTVSEAYEEYRNLTSKLPILQSDIFGVLWTDNSALQNSARWTPQWEAERDRVNILITQFFVVWTEGDPVRLPFSYVYDKRTYDERKARQSYIIPEFKNLSIYELLDQLRVSLSVPVIHTLDDRNIPYTKIYQHADEIYPWLSQIREKESALSIHFYVLVEKQIERFDSYRRIDIAYPSGEFTLLTESDKERKGILDKLTSILPQGVNIQESTNIYSTTVSAAFSPTTSLPFSKEDNILTPLYPLVDMLTNDRLTEEFMYTLETDQPFSEKKDVGIFLSPLGESYRVEMKTAPLTRTEFEKPLLGIKLSFRDTPNQTPLLGLSLYNIRADFSRRDTIEQFLKWFSRWINRFIIRRPAIIEKYTPLLDGAAAKGGKFRRPTKTGPGTIKKSGRKSTRGVSIAEKKAAVSGEGDAPGLFAIGYSTLLGQKKRQVDIGESKSANVEEGEFPLYRPESGVEENIVISCNKDRPRLALTKNTGRDIKQLRMTGKREDLIRGDIYALAYPYVPSCVAKTSKEEYPELEELIDKLEAGRREYLENIKTLPEYKETLADVTDSYEAIKILAALKQNQPLEPKSTVALRKVRTIAQYTALAPIHSTVMPQPLADIIASLLGAEGTIQRYGVINDDNSFIACCYLALYPQLYKEEIANPFRIAAEREEIAASSDLNLVSQETADLSPDEIRLMLRRGVFDSLRWLRLLEERYHLNIFIFTEKNELERPFHHEFYARSPRLNLNSIICLRFHGNSYNLIGFSREQNTQFVFPPVVTAKLYALFNIINMSIFITTTGLINSNISNSTLIATGQYLNNNGRIALLRVMNSQGTFYIAVPNYAPMNVPLFDLAEVRKAPLQQVFAIITETPSAYTEDGIWYPAVSARNPNDRYPYAFHVYTEGTSELKDKYPRYAAPSIVSFSSTANTERTIQLKRYRDWLQSICLFLYRKHINEHQERATVANFFNEYVREINESDSYTFYSRLRKLPTKLQLHLSTAQNLELLAELTGASCFTKQPPQLIFHNRIMSDKMRMFLQSEDDRINNKQVMLTLDPVIPDVWMRSEDFTFSKINTRVLVGQDALDKYITLATPWNRQAISRILHGTFTSSSGRWFIFFDSIKNKYYLILWKNADGSIFILTDAIAYGIYWINRRVVPPQVPRVEKLEINYVIHELLPDNSLVATKHERISPTVDPRYIEVIQYGQNRFAAMLPLNFTFTE